MVVAAAGAGAPSVPASAENGAYLWETAVGTVGPRGAVTFFGDSVGIGAERFGPTLTDHLSGHGWGPIRFRAVAGGRTGLPPGWGDHVNARHGIGGWSGRPGVGQQLAVVLAPAHARAASGTLTAVNPNAPTHVTVAPAGSAAATSNVNAAAGVTVANAVTTGASEGRAVVSGRAAGHLVFDTTGWWVPA